MKLRDRRIARERSLSGLFGSNFNGINRVRKSILLAGRIVCASVVSMSFVGAAQAEQIQSCVAANGLLRNFLLWGPLGEASENWAVTKWKGGIDYLIKDDTNGSSEAVQIANDVSIIFDRFKAATNLSIAFNKARLHNVAVIISNDIVFSDHNMPTPWKTFVGWAVGDGVDLAPFNTLHEMSVRTLTPRCGASIAFNKRQGVIGSYIYIQTGQDRRCPIIAISEALGVSNIRFELQNKQNTASEMLSDSLEAASELYNPIIEQGMSKGDVVESMKRICK